jgi:hypothetical protein
MDYKKEMDQGAAVSSPPAREYSAIGRRSLARSHPLAWPSLLLIAMPMR